MAYKFPWTNYHELNLDWILDTVKKLFAQTEKNNAVVEQYDGRLTEVELTADNAQTAAEQAQSDSAAALSLAQGAQTTATQAQQAAAQAQQAAGQAQTAAGQALEAAATAQQTATQAQQTAQNFDGRITQAENNAANALQAAQAFDEQVQGAITAANNANESATAALTTATEANQRSAETAQELANQRETLENIIESAEDDLSTKADVIINTESGNIASFNDGADDMPIKKLIANIKPAQDLHGYDSPWPAGGWKNIGYLSADNIYSEQQNTHSFINNGVVVTSSGNYGRVGFSVPVVTGETYTISAKCKRGSLRVIRIGLSNETSWNYTYGILASSSTITETLALFTKTITATSDVLCVEVYPGQNGAVITMEDFQVEKNSSVTSFAPYSNICPISGYTGLNLYHETEYDTDADHVISVTFPVEAVPVYGGEDEVISGNLESTMGMIDLGTLDWNISDRRFNTMIPISNAKGGNHADCICSIYKPDVGAATRTVDCSICFANNGYVYIYDTTFSGDASAFKTAMNGVQLCYELANPQSYQLEAQSLDTLYQNNAIWTDVGTVNIEYPADTKTYIDNKVAELQALILEH